MSNEKGEGEVEVNKLKETGVPSWAVGLVCDECGQEFRNMWEWNVRHTNWERNYHEECCPECKRTERGKNGKDKE